MKRTVFVDDLTGDEASTTLSFGLDDTMYEIDLNDENARELRETLDKYVKVARQKLMEAPSEQQEQRKSSANSKEIRKWAKRQGYNIKGFGRIPAQIMQEWEDSRQGIERPRRRLQDQHGVNRKQQQDSEAA